MAKPAGELALKIASLRFWQSAKGPACDVVRIAAFVGSGTIECAICDFADGAMTVSDAIIATSIRSVESADRVEIVLSPF
jgi:hypothetical protein